MKRRGKVFCKGRLAGELGETEEGKFVFSYNQGYLVQPSVRPVSLTLPLREEPYTAERLFISTAYSPKVSSRNFSAGI